MTGAFDTHSHIQDPQLIGDFDGVLERAAVANLAGIALCGYDAPSNNLALELAAKSPLLFPTVGFHPHEADDVTGGMLTELEALVALPEVVAVGEIGLDFYRNLSSAAAQRSLIDAQLGIALRAGKPVSVHSRSAEDAIFDHLRPFAEQARGEGMEVPGVMHCFGGTLEQAQPYVSLGFVISIACPVTYPANETTRELVRGLPLRSLVIETDSPYLPPQGRRGKLNEPSYVVEAAKAISAAKGVLLDDVLNQTTANARRLFRLPAAADVVAA